MNPRYYCLFLILLPTLTLRAGNLQPIRNTEIRLGHGAWQQDEDLLWQGEGYSGIYHIRGTITLNERHARPALFISVLGSYEVWWDGELIGENGKVGAHPEEEAPGAFYLTLPLARSQAQPGVHQLELRISNWRAGGKIRFYGALEGELDQLNRGRKVETIFFMSFVGFFGVAATLFLLFFVLVEKRDAYLTFSLLCLSVCFLLIMEYMKFFYNYPYFFHFPRLRIIAGLTGLSGLLLIRFCLVRVGTTRGRRWILPVSALIMLFLFIKVSGYDNKSFLIMITALCVSLPVVTQAWRAGLEGSRMMLFALLLCILPTILSGNNYMDSYFFLGIVGLILVLLVELAIHARDQRRKLEQSRLQSTILKGELMKKHIQPHFILNTLTSVMEWIEENPRTGIKMIEALAEEFRILHKIVDAGLIPVSEELALCRAHLEVMSFTFNRKLEMDVGSLDEDQQIPPGIFHTLLENALTHGDLTRGEPVFTLNRETKVNRTRFVISNPIDADKIHDGPEGTGLGYVKARLEAGFPGRWKVETGPVGDHWQITISIEYGEG